MSAGAALEADFDVHLGDLRLRLSIAVGAETLVIVGPNGSGKTSLLRLLLGVEPRGAGRVSLGGRTLTDSKNGILVPLEERRIGYVPQDYGLFPHFTVEQHLAFALNSLPRSRRPSSAERLRRVEQTLEGLALGPKRGHLPRALSGGERQRLALGRALVAEPEALLLDEPLAALDTVRRAEMREFLATYLKQLSLPMLLVTHDAADARFFPERIVVLENGQIAQAGSWGELAAKPMTAFAAQLIRS